MILRGGRIALDPNRAERFDLGIDGGRVRLPARNCAGPEIDCRGLIVLPGLINSHDHLEFNLFPRLGAGPYPNATAWAGAIYHPERDPVRGHLSIPKTDRLRWGGLKNLLSGVTTVMHHNPYDPLFDAEFPVRVVRRYGWAHSPAFCRDIAAAFRATPPGAPFVIHAAEGNDRCAAREIAALDAAGALRANTVLVHGVGVDEPGIRLLLERRCSLVWCPTSNQFLFGATLPPRVLGCGIPIALGTDSALTAAGDMADEVPAAAAIAGWERVYRMVTSAAAAILRLRDGEGEIRGGGLADLLLLRDRGQTPAEALADLRPEIVIVEGRIHLHSRRAQNRVPAAARLSHPIQVESKGEWLLRSPAPPLSPDLRLAGRRVA